MTQNDAERSAVERFRSTVQRSSVFIIMGVAFALPTLGVVYLIEPNAVGFYLIAATAMITHMVLISLDPDRVPEVDEDVSDLSGTEALLFVGLMLTSVLVAISIKLGIGAGLGYFLAVGSGDPVIGILAAITFPIIDRTLTRIRWYFSISAVGGIGFIYICALGLRAIDVVDHISRDTLLENSRRFSI